MVATFHSSKGQNRLGEYIFNIVFEALLISSGLFHISALGHILPLITNSDCFLAFVLDSRPSVGPKWDSKRHSLTGSHPGTLN